ncbi:MAG: PRC-barrel domain-containing protein [Rhodothermales bacterium]
MNTPQPTQTARNHAGPGLYRLKVLDGFEVANPDLDIRGWEVFGVDGAHIGMIEDLIVDPDRLEVRYVFVRMTEDASDDAAYVIIPIGMISADKREDKVHLVGVETAYVRGLPHFLGDHIERSFERSTRETLSRKPDATSAPDDDSFYQHPHFDGNRFLERRRRQLIDRAGALTSTLNRNPYLRRRIR